jgi:hypothetical protein
MAGTVTFISAGFSAGIVTCAEFSGGEVDFTDPADWSFPPAFPWTDTAPRREAPDGLTEIKASAPS